MLALLDFDEFHDVLLDATRDLLLDIQKEYDGKQLYAFYLFHDPLWGFILPKVAIEGGVLSLPKFDLNRGFKLLVNVALRVSPRSNPNLPKLRDYVLKNSDWQSPEIDWYKHENFSATTIGREYFESINMWLLRAQFYRVSFTHKQREQYHRTLTAICLDVLQALDKRGLFGEVRQQTLVNLVMMKDPNREYLQHAKDLNPPEVYQRWIEEIGS